MIHPNKKQNFNILTEMKVVPGLNGIEWLKNDMEIKRIRTNDIECLAHFNL